MNRFSPRTIWQHYTTVLVLLGLCAVLSVITWDEQHPAGEAGGRQLAGEIAAAVEPPAGVLIVVRPTEEDRRFAVALESLLIDEGYTVVDVVRGVPADARRAIERAAGAGQSIDVIACNEATASWAVLRDLSRYGAAAEQARVLYPRSYHWPNFLKLGNLRNIANQIAVIAIIAIGMTMVIIAGGIDLSVGSLVALAAVVCARLIRDYAGGTSAGLGGLVLCSLAAIGVGALAGLANGGCVTRLKVPPFIVTLATMSAASGLAFIVSDGESINDVPTRIEWLARGETLGGVPNAVVLMLLLYAAAHIVMSRTVFGRYLYAVGGNRQAAWLCGVPVQRVEALSYVVSGALSGVAGVLMVSQYRSGGPNYGGTYELQVIAAVVVGGTSLAGGRGKMFGTLLGALLIAVVQNGMNLMGVSSNPQKVVLGLVILAAALLDRLKRGGEEK